MMNEKALMDDLLRYRLEMLAKEVPELKLAFDGNNLILNVCVAYSRKVAAENVVLKERLDVAEARVEDQDGQIRQLRVQAETMLARLDRHGAWITERTKAAKQA
jgi:hypothetical protein